MHLVWIHPLRLHYYENSSVLDNISVWKSQGRPHIVHLAVLREHTWPSRPPHPLKERWRLAIRGIGDSRRQTPNRRRSTGRRILSCRDQQQYVVAALRIDQMTNRAYIKHVSALVYTNELEIEARRRLLRASRSGPSITSSRHFQEVTLTHKKKKSKFSLVTNFSLESMINPGWKQHYIERGHN